MFTDTADVKETPDPVCAKVTEWEETSIFPSLLLAVSVGGFPVMKTVLHAGEASEFVVAVEENVHVFVELVQS
jgi:hypothetical protein